MADTTDQDVTTSAKLTDDQRAAAWDLAEAYHRQQQAAGLMIGATLQYVRECNEEQRAHLRQMIADAGTSQMQAAADQRAAWVRLTGDPE